MTNIEEKLSALYDGELNESEVNEVLAKIDDDSKLKKKLEGYALISASMEKDLNNIQSISSNKISYRFWFSNLVTAAATVLITFC
jgi:negative regulator of sigma E activity